jgi:hypothetical protein
MREFNEGDRSAVLGRLGPLFVAAACTACLASFAAAESPATLLRPDYLSGLYPSGTFSYVNGVAGAQLFYNSGYYGGSTVIGNVEAGYIWGGHEVFDRTGLGLGNAVERQVAGTGVADEYDFHATMVGHVLGGYLAQSYSPDPLTTYIGRGMAPTAKLWSGAIATSYSTSTTSIGAFETTPASTIPVYRQFFQGIAGTKADVINSSFGGQDRSASAPEAIAIDALAFQNPTVLFVASAGNSGTAAVSAPANVYNGITVGSVGGTNFLTPSSFSSRGAVDFYNPVTNATVTGVRAAVDIAAPGELGFLAAYLGPTGGLAPLTDVTQDPSPDDLYFVNQDGTSFASPTVAGGVALMKDAAKDWWMGMPATALDSRVIKSVFMATSDRTVGWNNGQKTVGGVLRTTRSLDWATGAGALNLATAGLTYVNGSTMDVSGTSGGTIGANGWDFGAVAIGGTTSYMFSSALTDWTELQISLNWFTQDSFSNLTDMGTRSAFANLDLQVWRVVEGAFTSLVAESASTYNNAEFLRFMLPAGSQYGLRVVSPGMVYDVNAATAPVTSETYGLSWNLVAVPEPSAAAMAAAGAAFAAALASRRRRPGPQPPNLMDDVGR